MTLQQALEILAKEALRLRSGGGGYGGGSAAARELALAIETVLKERGS